MTSEALQDMLRWRASQVDGPLTVEHLSVEGLPYDEIPENHWEAVKDFRRRRQEDRQKLLKWFFSQQESDMDTYTLPLGWKVLQEEAIRQAKDLWDAQRAALEKWNGVPPGMYTWDEVDPLERQFWVEAQESIISDLSRPASRDLWVRWLEENYEDAGPYMAHNNRNAPKDLLKLMAKADAELGELLEGG